MKRRLITLPRIVWAVIFVFCAFYYVKWEKEAYNFYGDSMGYYLYLPSTFIYHNHKSIDTLPKDRGIRPFIHAYVGQIDQRTPKGYALNQYTYGVALMEAPFFFAAHAYEKLTGGMANGFSSAYQKSIMVSSWVYGALGLLLTYRILRRRFSKRVSSLTTALLLIGTNLYWFTMQQYGMAHVPLFFLFALLIYFTILVHETGRWKYFVGIGLTAGLITVIRPLDGLCVLIPLLYANGRPFIRAKVAFLLKHWAAVLLAGVCFLIPIIPQLLYWKWLTGYAIYDSYGPGQKFDFLHSHVWSGLFGASNGWMFYTPLMLLAVIGLLFIRRLSAFALCIPLFLVLYVYGIYAWFIPNYINGLGSRPMVDVYALLALPLAAFIEWVGNQKETLKAVAVTLIIAFTFINVNYTILQVLGNVWSQDSKYVYNLHTFFHYQLSYNDLVLWDTGEPQPDEKKLKAVEQPYCTRIADSTFSTHIVSDSLDATIKVYKISGDEEYAPLAILYPYSEGLRQKKPRWLKCSGRFMAPDDVFDIYKNHLLVIQIKRGQEVIKWHGVRINNKVGLLERPKKVEGEPALGYFRNGVWGTVSCYVPIPDEIQVGDIFNVDIWNIGMKPLYTSGMCVEFFN